MKEVCPNFLDEMYKVLELVGCGGGVKTYLVLNKRACKKQCMIIYEKSRFSSDIMNWIIKMSKLEHPVIPRIIDILENENYYFIIKEYLEGRTLDLIIKKSGAQAVETVVEWAKQLCSLLHYLHTLNPPHIFCGLKPGNILLMPDGWLKLIDFGTMRMSDTEKTNTFSGTIGYAAPEEFGGYGPVDERTDIYELGATMYHLVTGLDPSIELEMKPIRQINPALPESLEYIIGKCTQVHPEERYQSCEELLRALNGDWKPKRRKVF